MHKNSNDVRVVVSKTYGLTGRTRLRCTISSANGDYGFDNEIRGVEVFSCLLRVPRADA